MTNHYQNKPATLHGREVKIYLSKELLVIEVRLQSELVKGNKIYFIILNTKTEHRCCISVAIGMQTAIYLYSILFKCWNIISIALLNLLSSNMSKTIIRKVIV